MVKIDIVVPVLNEEHSLPDCIDVLMSYLGEELPQHHWRIVVVDNGSTDRTFEIAEGYAAQHSGAVVCTHLDQRGRGLALRKAWSESDADVLTYMDVDLSTGLDAFPALVSAIVDEGFDVAIGSRLKRGARTTRSLRRELISRSYNSLIKAMFWTRFSDAQCGFKGVSRAAAKLLIPAIKDNQWFFDTELLILAEKRGFRVKDIPVDWNEDSDTRVKLLSTVVEYLRGLARLRFGGIPHVSRGE